MFKNAEDFDQNLNDWDTEELRDMEDMFYGTAMSNRRSLPRWYEED